MQSIGLLLALRYAERRWSVLPIAPQSKRPLGSLAPRGVYDATIDDETIRAWFHRAPNIGIAIACGAASKLLVLDIDPRAYGDETLGALEKRYGRLPETPRVVTGAIGTHIYFAYDGVVPVRGSLGPGLDVKATGGYVLAPPSRHPETGRRYFWDTGALPSETTLASPPEWLCALLRTDARAFHGTAVGPAAKCFLGIAFAEAGWAGRTLANGALAVRCPWHELHSDGRGNGDDSSTVVLPPVHDARLGGFRCLHSHCLERTTADVIGRLPLRAKALASAAHPRALRGLSRARSQRSA